MMDYAKVNGGSTTALADAKRYSLKTVSGIKVNLPSATASGFPAVTMIYSLWVNDANGVMECVGVQKWLRAAAARLDLKTFGCGRREGLAIGSLGDAPKKLAATSDVAPARVRNNCAHAGEKLRKDCAHRTGNGLMYRHLGLWHKRCTGSIFHCHDLITRLTCFIVSPRARPSIPRFIPVLCRLRSFFYPLCPNRTGRHTAGRRQPERPHPSQSK